MPHNSHTYEFGPYRFDVDQRILTRTGETISLTPKAIDVLTLLVTNAGQLVAKDDLLKQVWPNTFVEENNLTQNIFLLRRVLGDERPAPRYIETVMRRGYRFVASVRVVDGRESGPSRTDARSQADDAAALRSVAVLPFVNATGNQDVEYLADGLTENIVNNLSRVAKLRVMSRSAVFRYRVKKELDPRVVGRELGVGAVLVGRLTARVHGVINNPTGKPEGDVAQPAVERPPAMGISVELVEVASGWQLWGDSFDCQTHDLLEIQDLITRHVLTALKLNLSGDEEKRITARYTESAEAYQSYLEARYHWSKYTRRGIEKAILHFRHAIERDPNYALAYDGLIDCYLRLTTNYLPPEESVSNAEIDSADAMSNICDVGITDAKKAANQHLDDSQARVKVRFEWDWRVAERELHRAQELRSGYPAAHQWYAAYRVAKRLFEQSTRQEDQSEAVKDCRLPIQILSAEPSAAEQLQVLCAVARGQIAVCNYEAAQLILEPFCTQNDWPKLTSLTAPAAADLLFTLGILIASLATTKQTTNSYRQAAAFLNGSIAMFEYLGLKSSSVEARAELARCYYRQGLFDIARETLSWALREVPEDQLEIRCRCLNYSGMLERDAGRLTDAINRLREAADVMAPVGPLASLRNHLEIAGTLKDLAMSEKQETYNDEAKFHYRTALYESEAIGDHRTTATIENNFGLFLLNLHAWSESEKHLLRSRRFFESLSDKFRRAQVNETLTRLYIATNQYSIAQEAITDSIQTLRSTDSEAVLCEALTTGAIVSAKLGLYREARNRFEAAYNIADRCGDREGARRALVSMFDEMNEHLDSDELRHILNKLQKLHSVTEPSSVVRQVEQTIVQIEAIVKKETSCSPD